MSLITVAIIGLGDWGPNLVRNFARLTDVTLYAVCDMREEVLSSIGRQYPAARLTTDYTELLNDPNVDAVVVATPVASHHTLVKEFLKAGKHVLVEKPLATTSVQCRELVDLADQRSKVLMVGHVFLYNAAVSKLRSIIQSGAILRGRR